MNSIRANIMKQVKEGYDDCTREINEIKIKLKTVDDLIDGMYYGQHRKELYTYSVYLKARKAREKYNDKLDGLHAKRGFIISSGDEAYKRELQFNSIISNRYKPKNKLMTRRPL